MKGIADVQLKNYFLLYKAHKKEKDAALMKKKLFLSAFDSEKLLLRR
jgi:hypothetical protein